jgi:hypothetical protein
MTKIKVILGKPKVIVDINTDLTKLSAFIIEVEIESLIEKCWSRFQWIIVI